MEVLQSYWKGYSLILISAGEDDFACLLPGTHGCSLNYLHLSVLSAKPQFI